MKIAIIGGVAAGMSAATKAKRLLKNCEITIYEQTGYVSWGSCGLPYYIGDFFADPNTLIARPIEKFRESGIDVKLFHRVLHVNPAEKTLQVENLETGETFTDSYDKLMIATGANAIIPPIKNIDLQNVHFIKGFDDAVLLKDKLKNDSIKNIAIIGAGFIGIEMAEAFKKHGKNIRIIQLDRRILPDVFDKEITDVLEAELRSHDITLHTEERVTEFKGATSIERIVTNQGEYPADLVIICTGVKPATAFLAGTGIETLPNGALIIDAHGQTNVADIYAAGDCASVHHTVLHEDVFIPLATTANKIGRIVGENLAGHDSRFEGTLGSAAVKVMDFEAGRTGITEGDAVRRGIRHQCVFINDKNQTNFYPDQQNIYVKLIYDPVGGALLGGQIAGKKGAVLRVDVLAAAIQGGLTVSQLGMLDLCYAPPFARTWDVLNIAGNAAKAVE